MSEVNRITGVNQDNINTIKNNSSNSAKASFSSFLGESKSLDEVFDKAAEKYNVPVNLLKAIGKAESGFDAKAVSRCGAQGIMQLMPATAASLGVANSFDPEQNIMGGAKYISGLLKKYNGNSSLALAAYNAGSGNVAKYGGIPPFEETQNYVVKVTNYMKQGGNTDIPDTNPTAPTPANAPSVSSNTVTPANNSSDIFIDDGNISQDMDAIFSYEEYLEFLDEFTKEDDNKEEENSNYFASKSINYNIPVMNLMNKIF